MSDDIAQKTKSVIPIGFDLISIPGVGRLLLWKHSRSVFQSALFIVAAMMVVDGLFGSPLAAKNTATIAAWVHYRGIIVIMLLAVGNLFCAGCPFMLSRRLAKSIGRPRQRWPRALRNKWLAIAAFLGMLFAYELFDLWASPWLTAWVIVGYFLAAFALEALFTNDSFCKYVCPLGTFNFLYSSVSPTQIVSRDAAVCRQCAGKECINGRFADSGRIEQKGCQLELYVPTLTSNLDCTLCLDCARACPYHNVGWVVRPWGEELARRAWPRRLDLSLLAILASFAGLVNAYAMTPPAYVLEQYLADLLHTQREFIVLGTLFIAGAVGVPLALAFGAAWINRLTAYGKAERLRDYVIRYAYCFVPAGFGIWTAHYLFHLLIGPLTIAPAVQRFVVVWIGTPLLGEPNWALGGMLTPPLTVVNGVQLAAVSLGTLFALWLGWLGARDSRPSHRRALSEFAPWVVILVMLSVAAMMVFLLPMEMRGNVLG